MSIVRPIATLGRVRIALPQDEFLNTDILCDFIRDFRIDLVCSVSPESEWPKIYRNVDRSQVRFCPVLTGYLSDSTVRRIDEMLSRTRDRRVDVGYRAWHAAPWLGRHGQLKSLVADYFAKEAPQYGLVCDISTDVEQSLLGDQWFKFLLGCKYTIGVEGGSSILDHDGSLRMKTEQYLEDHPHASFDQVESACFPGQDGSVQLFAISPRHLEACATKTCQVLVEGHYNGVLQPHKHYIELRRDFSNLHEVLVLMRDDCARSTIVESAYRDIVLSGRASYIHFINQISIAISEICPLTASFSPRSRYYDTLSVWFAYTDRLSWFQVYFRVRIYLRSRRRAKRLIMAIARTRYGRALERMIGPRLRDRTRGRFK